MLRVVVLVLSLRFVRVMLFCCLVWCLCLRYGYVYVYDLCMFMYMFMIMLLLCSVIMCYGL